MPAKQPGANDAFSVDFTRPFDQAQEQAKSVFATQKELLDALERMNEYWFARAKSEAELVTSVANKLASARSMPRLDRRLSGLVGPAHAALCRRQQPRF